MIFRKEAFESKINGFSNPVSIKGSLALHIMLGGVLVAIILLITFGLITDYSKKVSVKGFLEPKKGSVKIFSTKIGKLNIDVENGAQVSKGEQIAHIINDDTNKDGRSIIDLEIKSLRDASDLAKEQLILAESRLKTFKEQEKLSMYQHKIDIESSKKIVSKRQEQLRLAKENLTRSQILADKKMLSRTVLEDVYGTVISTELALSEAQSKLTSLQTKTDTLKIEWKMQENALRKEINDFQRDVLSAENKLEQAIAQKETIIISPSSGVVTYASAQHDENVNVGQELFYITSNNDELVAVLLAPSTAIGFAKIGDSVNIRYDAYPYSEHGIFIGDIISIDKTAQVPNTIRSPIAISEPVYKIVVKVEQIPVSKSGALLKLRSGMKIEASIILDKKPLIFWLFDPIF
ncbi:HlyD family efflux transporter periplasmic adaptor subunit [Vibrio cholerae]|uniref:HlyD family secretion protein n=1 Tax=Vibrio cholerae TaxID=666 RepID=UPI001159C62A|nr:HlyD family efflux transporter periplasmic adaptor subunit [Vibrio cholerae]TQQ47236.1 HlyD family efflux transporter periplasmic adaptor subunit [Vibrio cholerae]